MDDLARVELDVGDPVAAVAELDVVGVQHPQRRLRRARARRGTGRRRTRRPTTGRTGSTGPRSRPCDMAGLVRATAVSTTRPSRRRRLGVGDPRRGRQPFGRRRGTRATARWRSCRRSARWPGDTAGIAGERAPTGSAPGIGCPNGPPPDPLPLGPSHHNQGCSTSQPSGELNRTSRPSVACNRFVVICRSASPAPAARRVTTSTGRLRRGAGFSAASVFSPGWRPIVIVPSFVSGSGAPVWFTVYRGRPDSGLPLLERAMTPEYATSTRPCARHSDGQ